MNNMQRPISQHPLQWSSWWLSTKKMDSMAIEMNHLQMDQQKVAERTAAFEDDVDALKQEVKSLMATVSGLKSSATLKEEHLEDVEGRSRRNNTCLIGFLECAEGP
ncbi:hypothetical protein NDU88_005088 [Pleurodeles waltl]|uniref:Uncharacterized protein n=1 Tax=Pleurodeles waltl TaxID=8319 RepID=A0AAV7WBR0_PLEWA|nr:hypothetical protein NDU88_005088 [Pleurodeles waltl]